MNDKIKFINEINDRLIDTINQLNNNNDKIELIDVGIEKYSEFLLNLVQFKKKIKEENRKQDLINKSVGNELNLNDKQIGIDLKDDETDDDSDTPPPSTILNANHNEHNITNDNKFPSLSLLNVEDAVKNNWKEACKHYEKNYNAKESHFQPGKYLSGYSPSDKNYLLKQIEPYKILIIQLGGDILKFLNFPLNRQFEITQVDFYKKTLFAEGDDTQYINNEYDISLKKLNEIYCNPRQCIKIGDIKFIERPFHNDYYRECFLMIKDCSEKPILSTNKKYYIYNYAIKLMLKYLICSREFRINKIKPIKQKELNITINGIMVVHLKKRK